MRGDIIIRQELKKLSGNKQGKKLRKKKQGK